MPKLRTPTGVLFYSKLLLIDVFTFLKSSYPLERDWDISVLKDMLKNIIHDIGRKESFPQLSDVVFLKLLNDSFGVRSRLKSEPKKPEIACLLDPKMI